MHSDFIILYQVGKTRTRRKTVLFVHIRLYYPLALLNPLGSIEHVGSGMWYEQSVATDHNYHSAQACSDIRSPACGSILSYTGWFLSCLLGLDPCQPLWLQAKFSEYKYLYASFLYKFTSQWEIFPLMRVNYLVYSAVFSKKTPKAATIFAFEHLLQASELSKSQSHHGIAIYTSRSGNHIHDFSLGGFGDIAGRTSERHGELCDTAASI